MSNRPRLSHPAARRHTPNLPAAHLRRRSRTPVGATAALFVALTAAVPGAAATHTAAAQPAATRPAATHSAATHSAAGTHAVTAAAPDLIRGRQWALEALHIPRTWRYSRGAGVTVAVLDTGVDGQHPDLTGTVIPGPDFTGQSRSPGSKYWGRHGTAMASIIAGHGHGPSQEAGIVGVAPRTKILSIRVTLENEDPARRDKEQLNRSRDAVAKGIRYAVDNGALVINMSLGGGTAFYDGSQAEEEAVKYALRQGAVLVASSGNDGEKLNRRTFPAAYPGVIAVGAVNRRMRPTSFSNHHDYVSVAAPGDDIVMADTGQGYVVGTGTSPSAAYVAGTAALVRSRYPQLTPEQVRKAIEQGTVHRPPGGRDERVGAGVLDTLRTLTAAREIDRTAYATTAPQATQAAPLPESRPEKAPNAVVVVVLIVGTTVLLCGVLMLFLNLRRRSRDTVDPIPMDAEWAEDDWAEDDWDARERLPGATGEAPAVPSLLAAPVPASVAAPGAGAGAAADTARSADAGAVAEPEARTDAGPQVGARGRRPASASATAAAAVGDGAHAAHAAPAPDAPDRLPVRRRKPLLKPPLSAEQPAVPPPSPPPATESSGKGIEMYAGPPLSDDILGAGGTGIGEDQGAGGHTFDPQTGPHASTPHSLGAHSAGLHSAGLHSAGSHSAGSHSAGSHAAEAGPDANGPGERGHAGRTGYTPRHRGDTQPDLPDLQNLPDLDLPDLPEPAEPQNSADLQAEAAYLRPSGSEHPYPGNDHPPGSERLHPFESERPHSSGTESGYHAGLAPEEVPPLGGNGHSVGGSDLPGIAGLDAGTLRPFDSRTDSAGRGGVRPEAADQTSGEHAGSGSGSGINPAAPTPPNGFSPDLSNGFSADTSNGFSPGASNGLPTRSSTGHPADESPVPSPYANGLDPSDLPYADGGTSPPTVPGGRRPDTPNQPPPDGRPPSDGAESGSMARERGRSLPRRRATPGPVTPSSPHPAISSGPLPPASAPARTERLTGPLDDRPTRRSVRDRPCPLDTDFPAEPLPMADPSAQDMGTPIAEQSWMSLRQNRSRRHDGPAESMSPEPEIPSTPSLPQPPPAEPLMSDFGLPAELPVPAGSDFPLSSDIEVPGISGTGLPVSADEVPGRPAESPDDLMEASALPEVPELTDLADLSSLPGLDLPAPDVDLDLPSGPTLPPAPNLDHFAEPDYPDDSTPPR